MAHDLAVVHRQLVLAPDRRCRPKVTRGTMHIGVQTPDRGQRGFGARRGRPHTDGHELGFRFVRMDVIAPRFAGDVAQDLAALVVETQHLGRPGEARRAQMPKESVDRRRPRTGWPAHGLADSDDACRGPAATKSVL